MTSNTPSVPPSVRAGLRRWFLQPPRRHGEVDEDRTVSFLELFYDLVFVILIAQAAHTLAVDVTWESVGDFVVIFALIWIAWLNGTQYHEIHGREDGRSRTFLFIQMILLAVMAVYTGHAADEDGRAFAITYSLLLVVLFWQWFGVRRVDDEEYRPLTNAYLVGLIAAFVLMVFSATLDEQARIYIWAATVVIWVTWSLLLSSRRTPEEMGYVVTESMVERFGLFIIIVLGEVIVGVVEGLSEAERDGEVMATGVLAMIVAFAIWWNYFDFVGRRLPRRETNAVVGWLSTHLPTAMAIAAAGAAMVGLVEHAGDDRTPAATAWLMGGSVAIVLVGIAAAMATLQDAKRLRSIMRPTMVVMLGAAVGAVVLAAIRPTPLVFVIALVALLGVAWWVAFVTWLRSGTLPQADAVASTSDAT